MNTIRLPMRFKKDNFEMETILENTDEYYANLLGLTVQIVGCFAYINFLRCRRPNF